jgi:hypothetical protein
MYSTRTHDPGLLLLNATYFANKQKIPICIVFGSDPQSTALEASDANHYTTDAVQLGLKNHSYIRYHEIQKQRFGLVLWCLTPLSNNVSVISWMSVLLGEETAIDGEDH